MKPVDKKERFLKKIDNFIEIEYYIIKWYSIKRYIL